MRSGTEKTHLGQVVLMGRGREIVSRPQHNWKDDLGPRAREIRALLAFMSNDHHRIRNFVVTEIPRSGGPIPPQEISRRLQLRPDRVAEILDELERNLFFVVRNDRGAVVWAFPVTAEPTRHRLKLDSGERLWAA